MEFPGGGWSHEKSSRERALEEELSELEEKHRMLDLEKGLDEWHIETLGIDHLTGASTRKAFEARLDQAFESMGRKGGKERRGAREVKEVSLIFVDLDNFKTVNDTIGHTPGDRVLQKAASLLRASLREDDVLGRYGGDEFVVLLVNAGSGEAIAVAEKLRTALADDAEMKSLSITGSIGVCSSSASGVATPGELTEKADHAMYAAKNGGKNRVEVYKEGHSMVESK